jgi:hypothetical protein
MKQRSSPHCPLPKFMRPRLKLKRYPGSLTSWFILPRSLHGPAVRLGVDALV